MPREDTTPNIPRLGMLATVRNRRGIVTSVEPYQGTGEVVHLVTVEYLDGDGVTDDTLVWELEPGAHLLEPTTLPDPARVAPMVPDEFDALVRATRWGALTPFIDPDGSDGPLTRLPITAPMHGAIQAEDYQLVPLLMALRMPRVSLLLADDVGLGKTIEAGLILSELLNRRRIRRVLILSPASLLFQWQQEMRDKFSLTFDIITRDETHALRKRMGMDANPWRTYSRAIASYYYLKQPDVLEEFLASSQVKDGSPHLPWDLLIVDEAHNLTPSPFGEDSELTKMLQAIAPLFEHKLFLTATPHNGHTRSFSGLLELLDPVRFSQKDELTAAERDRIEDVVVRRLKREINARTNPPRFCERTPVAVPLRLSTEEMALSAAFRDFREAVRYQISSARRSEQLAGIFAVEVLGKRLLSCPVSFADSWRRCQLGMSQDEQAAADEVRAAQRATEEDTGDDREQESRTAHAAHVVGAWLKPLASSLQPQIQRINTALAALGLGDAGRPAAEQNPRHDARFDAFCHWIDDHLRTPDGRWRNDERLVLFTEYKTSLDYLARRLRDRYRAGDEIRVLYGGMDLGDREAIKAAFNDPADPVRILLATDTGSEGQNLQETARYLLHFDVPWNPARLEQRNGRLDRHGQARDVSIFHFTTNDDADIDFLGYVIHKVDQIREDLGATGELFDAAFQRRFIHGEDDRTVRGELDLRIEKVRGRAAVPSAKAAAETGVEESQRLQALRDELDLDSGTLKDTLDIALSIGVGRPRLDGPDDRGKVRFRQPVPQGWNDLVTDSLRLPSARGQLGAMPALTFDPHHFVTMVGERPVFRPQKDTVLLHLAHPMFRRVLATFARARFPGSMDERLSSRWTVRRCPVPDGADALLLLTVEELGVNDLRESFHHWVRTLRIPIRNGELDTPLPHETACSFRLPGADAAPADATLAHEIWTTIQHDVGDLVDELAAELTTRLHTALEIEFNNARQQEMDRYQSRQGELSTLIVQTTLQRLEREIVELKQQREQGVLFNYAQQLADIDASIRLKEEEVRRRQEHYAVLRDQLDRERRRVIEYLLPKRFALRGQAQVFPVAVELRLPEAQ